MKELLSEAGGDENVMRYLPSVKKEIFRMPKSYVANVIYSVIGEPFRTWVNSRIEQRNHNILEKKDDNVEVTQEFKDAVNRTT